MKGITQTKGFQVVTGTIVTLMILIIFTGASGGSVLSSILGFLTTPMLSVSASAAENITDFTDLNAYSKEELKELVEQLTKQNQELQSQLVDYAQTKKENEGLREQLSIVEENPEPDYCYASVVGRDPNDAFYNFSIDKGYLAGIQAGDPVISAKGLVGTISEVYATTSRVTTILSPDNKVAVYALMLEDESGVISSDILTAASGAVRMNYLKNTTTVQPGTVICTSGAGGLYPKDLVVGYVTDVAQSNMDISKTAIVQPYEDVKTVRDVQVITNFPGKDSQDMTSESSKGNDPEAGA